MSQDPERCAVAVNVLEFKQPSLVNHHRPAGIEAWNRRHTIGMPTPCRAWVDPEDIFQMAEGTIDAAVEIVE